MKKKQKTVLVVEASSHYKTLEQIYHLLNSKCRLTFYVVKPRYEYIEMFPSATSANVKAESFRGLLLFYNVLIRGWRFDIINISTGPEDEHNIINIMRIPGFYLCCLLYGAKMILTVRNIPPYLRSTSGLSSWLRSRAIRHIKRFTFETATMKKEFCKRAEHTGAYYSVSYDRYPDTITANANVVLTDRTKASVRIGLLGTVTEERRDYGPIFDALSNIPADVRAHIEFVVIGNCQDGMHNHIIKRFEGLARVVCTSGMLSEKEFSLRGVSCDVLLAPLSSKRKYGTLNGTGSIGDAIYLKRRIIIPDFVDKEREFEDFCVYYTTASELARIFLQVACRLDQSVSDSVFAKFETHNVYKSLVEDLHLCPIG